MDIDVKDYMERQPFYPRVTDTDRFYYPVAVQLAHAWDLSGVLTSLDDAVRTDAVMAVVGYFQDIVADAGLWRTFTRHHQQQHGTPLPHYGRADGYVDYELNLDDVRCVLWYTLNAHAPLDPHDPQLATLASVMHAVLDQVYVEAPASPELLTLFDVDINNEMESRDIYNLAYWLFWKSYLLRPWAVAAANDAAEEAAQIISDCQGRDATPLLHDLNDRILATTHAGPIPLPIAQWMEMITRQQY